MNANVWSLEEGIDWPDVLRKARNGDADAEYYVGSAYMDGLNDHKGISLARKNVRLAVEWLTRAASKGHSDAQASLGYCYDIGLGVREDKAEAMKWYKRAHRAGGNVAANNIATLYEEKGNMRRAYYWYVAAAELGNDESLFKVARCLLTGTGVRKNEALGLEYLVRVTESDCITVDSHIEARELLRRHRRFRSRSPMGDPPR